MPVRRLTTVALLPMGLAACFGRYEPAQEQDSESSSGTTTGVTSTGPGTTDGTTDTGPSESSTSTGGDPDATGSDTTGTPVQCDHLDILFVADVSISMLPFTSILQELLPLAGDFINALEPIDSYHIGFTTNSGVPHNAGAYVPPEGTTGGSTGSSSGGSATAGPGDSGGGGEAPSCEGLGSLLRARDQECYEMLQGRPYIAKGDPVASSVMCLLGGLVVLDEAVETPRTVEAILAAVGDANEPGGCNEGFHEPGDPLIIVAIADTDDPRGPNSAVAAATLFANEGIADGIALTYVSAPVCSCPGTPDACRSDPECPADPPCKLADVADSLFGEEQEGRIQQADLCETLGGNTSPLQEALMAAVAEQLPLVCPPR